MMNSHVNTTTAAAAAVTTTIIEMIKANIMYVRKAAMISYPCNNSDYSKHRLPLQKLHAG